MNFRRQRAYELEPRHGQELWNLLHGKLCLAPRQYLADETARLCSRLGLDLLRDAEALNHFHEVHPARATGGMGNRFGVKQRTLEGFEAAYVGLAGSGAHRDPGAAARKLSFASGSDQPLLRQLVDYR